MAIYLSNRDGDGKTDEQGHYKFQTSVFSGNVLGIGHLVVSEDSPTDLSVLVAPGQFKIDTDSDYSYTGWNTSSVSVAINTADPANPRISSIVLYVDKNETTSDTPPNNPGIVKLLSVDGTPGAVPVAPNNTTIQSAVGSGNPFTVLANVTVGAAETEIEDADISDQRVLVSVAPDLINENSILDSAITSDKLAALSVTSGKLATDAVTTTKVQDAAVTDAKWRNLVAFRATKTTSQTLQAEAVIVFNNEEYDLGSNYDTSDGKFTAPFDGIYFFRVGIYTEATATARAFANLYKNGSAARGQDVSGTRVYRVETSQAWKLNAGDYVQGGGYSVTGTNVNSSQTTFSGFLVTRT